MLLFVVCFPCVFCWQPLHNPGWGDSIVNFQVGFPADPSHSTVFILLFVLRDQ